MKRKVMMILIAAILIIINVISCSKKRIPVIATDIIPTKTNTPAFTNTPFLTATTTRTRTVSPTISATITVTQAPPDISLYPFEDGTIMNWNFYLGSGITNTANSTNMAYMGSRSLRIDGVFKAAESNGAAVTPPSVSNVVGKILSVHVYIPADYPGGGGALYMQSGAGWCWQRGPWTNFTVGAWNTLTLDPANPEWTDTAQTPDHTAVHRAGIAMQPSSNYTGSIYMDTFDIVSLGTPTFTRTKTISPTPTISRTPGGPTETITPTHSITPTITITHTAISTPIGPASMGSNVQYYGRWNMAVPAQPKNGWGTTYMVAGFEGTSIALNFSAWDTWFAYAIDGDIVDHNSFTKFRVRNESVFPTQTPYVITGLADTAHTIMIVRRTDGMGGVVKFNGFGLDTGKTMTSPSYTVPTRKMEFIGDSITCGSVDEYNLAVPTPDCQWGSCIQNGDMAFGPQAARLLNAEWRTISRGGIGIYRNCNPCPPNNVMAEIYPFMYFETDPTVPAGPAWNTATWQPDVIVIAIGTNDFSSTSPVADKTLFQTAYTNFLTSLRGYYPNTHIICTEPIPTWGGVQLANAAPYISEVVTNMADAAIHFMPVNTPPAVGFPLVSAEYANDSTHPIVTAQTKMANAIVAWMTSSTLTAHMIANHGW